MEKTAQLGVGQGLGIIGPSTVVGGAREGLRIGGIDETDLDSLVLQRIGEEVPGATVEIGRTHHIVACAREVLDGESGSCLAGCQCKRRRAAVERGQALFQDIHGRIADPRIDIAEFLEGEQICGMLSVAKLEGRRLINWRSHRTGRRIGTPARMEGERFRMKQFRRHFFDPHQAGLRQPPNKHCWPLQGKASSFWGG